MLHLRCVCLWYTCWKVCKKILVKDDVGEVIGAIYSRITVGVANDIKWSGEPVVEVKIRCDNDDRLFQLYVVVILRILNALRFSKCLMIMYIL